MTQAAYAGWKADMLAGKVTLMAAAINAVVTELSAQARADAWPPDRSSPEPSSVTGTWPARRLIVTRHNDRRMPVYGGRDWLVYS
jgi:hypothetical protein